MCNATVFCRRNLKLLFLPPANEVRGKVMFLHLSVILFTMGGRSASEGEGVCLQGVLHQVGLGSPLGLHLGGEGPVSGEWGGADPSELEKRTVHILLELFLLVFLFGVMTNREDKINRILLQRKPKRYLRDSVLDSDRSKKNRALQCFLHEKLLFWGEGISWLSQIWSFFIFGTGLHG